MKGAFDKRISHLKIKNNFFLVNFPFVRMFANIYFKLFKTKNYTIKESFKLFNNRIWLNIYDKTYN